ncbi:MAG TPA: ABC transporter ATP-binding protein, partial [Lachnospiraceae bacterium]|nr:ABC transporter ATP-binding protein [Lachnospiraceae bacterium]
MAEQRVKEVKMGRNRAMGPKPKLENPGKIFKRLVGYAFSRYIPHIIIVMIAVVVSVLAQVRGTMFIKILLDDYIEPLSKQSNPDFTELLHQIYIMAIIFGVGIISTYVYSKIMIYVSQGTLNKLRMDLFSHMERLPIRYFDSHSHGDIMSIYTNDVDTIRQMIGQSLPSLLSSAITIVSVFCSMVILSLPLTGVTVAMVVVMMFTTKKVAGLSGQYFLAQQKNLGAINGYIEEMMEGQKVVKVFCHETKSLEQFNEKNDELFDSAQKANRYVNILGPINMQLGNVSFVLCSVVGGVLAIGGFGGFTLGSLASFLTFNKSFNMPINQISQQFNSIIMALAGADRIFKLLDEPVEVDDGYVTLVNARYENGQLVESKERTGIWAWRH